MVVEVVEGTESPRAVAVGAVVGAEVCQKRIMVVVEEAAAEAEEVEVQMR